MESSFFTCSACDEHTPAGIKLRYGHIRTIYMLCHIEIHEHVLLILIDFGWCGHIQSLMNWWIDVVWYRLDLKTVFKRRSQFFFSRRRFNGFYFPFSSSNVSGLFLRATRNNMRSNDEIIKFYDNNVNCGKQWCDDCSIKTNIYQRKCSRKTILEVFCFRFLFQLCAQWNGSNSLVISRGFFSFCLLCVE